MNLELKCYLSIKLISMGNLRPSYKMQHNLTVEGNHRQRFRDTELVEK